MLAIAMKAARSLREDPQRRLEYLADLLLPRPERIVEEVGVVCAQHLRVAEQLAECRQVMPPATSSEGKVCRRS